MARITTTGRRGLLLATVAALALPGTAQAAFGDADATYGFRGAAPLRIPRVGLVPAEAPVAVSARLLADGGSEVIAKVGDGRRGIGARLRYDAAGARRGGPGELDPIAVGPGALDVHASSSSAAGVLLGGALATGRGTVPVVVRTRADGSLDRGFGDAGVVFLPTFGAETRIASVARLADGGVLVVAEAYKVGESEIRAVLLRLRANGRAASYGRRGAVVIPLGNAVEGGIGAVVTASDGAVTLAVGAPAIDDSASVYLRRRADGGADRGFGGDGVVTYRPDGETFFAGDLALDADGVVVAGTTFPAGGEPRARVVRLRADGSPDLSFGASGLRDLVPAGATASRGRRVVRRADGSLVVAGDASFPTAPTTRTWLARLDGSGDPLAGFGTDGVVVSPASEPTSVAALATAPGRSVIVGPSGDGMVQTAVADTGVASASTDLNGGFSALAVSSARLVPDADGGVLGFARFGSGLRIAALDRAGEPLATLGGPGARGGVALPNGPSGNQTLTQRLHDGRLLVLASVSNAARVLVLTAAGSPDPAFGGGDGIVELGPGTAAAAAVELTGGRLLIGGGVFDGAAVVWRIRLLQLLPNGAPDPAFGGGDGVVDLDYPAGTFESTLPPGAIHVTATAEGYLAVAGSNRSPVLVRVDAAGTPVASFGSGGVLAIGAPFTRTYDAASDQQGRTLVVGSVGDATGERAAVVLRVRPDGTLDPSFDGDGIQIIEPGRGVVRAEGVAALPDGGVVLANLVLPGGGSGIAVEEVALLSPRGALLARRTTQLATSDSAPVPVADGRILMPAYVGGSFGEASVARLLGRPPAAARGRRIASRTRTAATLSALVDARGLTGVRLVVETLRDGRWVAAGRATVPATVGAARRSVRVRRLPAGQDVRARLVVVNASGRANGAPFTLRAPG